MSTTTHSETHRSTPWLWAWLASIMAFLAAGVIATPAGSGIPLWVRGLLMSGAMVVGAGSTLVYVRAELEGGDQR